MTCPCHAGEVDETSGKGPGYERERQRPEAGSRVTDTRTGSPSISPVGEPASQV